MTSLRIASACAVLVVAAAAQVSADTVTYYTVGIFTSDGTPGVTVGPSNVISSTAPGAPFTNGSSAITYNAVGSTTTTVNESPFDLGSFTLSSTNTATFPHGFGSSTFVLQIWQTHVNGNPVTPTFAEYTANLSDIQIKRSATGNQFILNFEPNSVYLPDAATGYKYSVNDVNVQPNLSSGSATINSTTEGSGFSGSVATPLPGVAYAGMTMLGGCGLFAGLLRRRRGNDAVAA